MKHNLRDSFTVKFDRSRLRSACLVQPYLPRERALWQTVNDPVSRKRGPTEFYKSEILISRSTYEKKVRRT